jgi:hypothetical protein
MIHSRYSFTRYANAIWNLIVFFGPVLLGAAVLSVSVAALFHWFSVRHHNPQLAFIEVFPNVFYVVFIIGIILRIIQYIPDILTFF